MPRAVIDLGSNTACLLIASNDESGLKILEDRIDFIRLGENLKSTGRISEAALQRLETYLDDIQKLFKKYQVNHIQMVSTAAARLAKNQEDLKNLVEKYNISFQIISAEEEARFSFEGTFFNLPLAADKDSLIIDIGGLSTEFVTLSDFVSLNLGTVGLKEEFNENPNQVNYVEKALENLQSKFKSCSNLIFVAGTPTTLACLEYQTTDISKIHGKKLSDSIVEKWLKKISNLSIEERKKNKFLPVYRQDVIISGLYILKTCLKYAGHKAFYVSTTGLRYGLIDKSLKTSV